MDKFNQFRETFFFVHCISQMKFFETQYAIQKNKRDWSIGRLHKKQNLRWWKANQHQRKNRNNNRMQEDSFNSELWEFQINPQLVNWCLLQLIVVITDTLDIERVNAMIRIKQFALMKKISGTIFFPNANIVPFLYNERVLRKIDGETGHRILIFCGDECLVRVNILASWWVGLGVGCTTWHGSPLNFSNSPTLAPPKPSHSSLAIILALRASALSFLSALLLTNWVKFNCPPTPLCHVFP